MVVKVDAQDISGREEKDRSEFDESVLCITQKWFSVYVCRLLKLYWYSWLQDYHYISPGSSNENNLRYIVKTSFTEYIYIYIYLKSLWILYRFQGYTWYYTFISYRIYLKIQTNEHYIIVILTLILTLLID